MSQGTQLRWETLRTDETRLIEDTLRPEFPQTDAYRYNPAAIKVRVIDPRFKGKSIEERDAMVDTLLTRLPESIQADIMSLLTLTPSELNGVSRHALVNLEFEDPSRSSF